MLFGLVASPFFLFIEKSFHGNIETERFQNVGGHTVYTMYYLYIYIYKIWGGGKSSSRGDKRQHRAGKSLPRGGIAYQEGA